MRLRSSQGCLNPYSNMTRNDLDSVEHQIKQFFEQDEIWKALKYRAIVESGKRNPSMPFIVSTGPDGKSLSPSEYWRNYDPAIDMPLYQHIFTCLPPFLPNMSDEDLKKARIGAAMIELGGEPNGKQWVEPRLIFAAHLILKHAIFLTTKNQYFEGEMKLPYAEIIGCKDSCEACKQLHGRTYTPEQIPDLPHPACTHSKGCRCCLSGRTRR